MSGPTQIAYPTIQSAQVGHGPQGLSAKGGDLEAARKSAVEFEGMFLSQMYGHLFDSLKTDGPFGGGHAEKMYRSLLVDEYGKTMARAGGIGIADQVMKEILRNQEAVKP